MLTDVLDVCRCSPMSWMYVKNHRCPGCMSMLTDVLDVMVMLYDVLDVSQSSPMSWMHVDTLCCTGYMLMLTDVLNVC